MTANLISELEAALTRNPYDPATLINLGKLYINDGRIAKALRVLRSAAGLWPDIFLAQNYLGDAYCLATQPHEAIRHYELALALRPGDIDVITNLSVCHWQIGDIDTAYRYAFVVRDQRPVNFGLLSLLLDDYEEGWKHWEYLNTAQSINGLPRWEGEDIRGKRLLVLDEEQGFGDTIMLARFLPMLADQCKHVTFQTRSSLIRLMGQSFPAIDVTTDVPEITQFDAQVRLFSLPRLFRTRPETIPRQPYLRSKEDECVRWRAKLASHNGVKIGLRWSGSPDYPMDHMRSIQDVSVLEPLGDISEVTYISLAKEICDMPNIPILHFGDELTDFAETAALLQSLDLFISTDTGVVNLAGALGVPTWLLSYQFEWRWGTTGDHSPWYPSVRVFRQPVIGDWSSVIAKIKANLVGATSHTQRL